MILIQSLCHTVQLHSLGTPIVISAFSSPYHNQWKHEYQSFYFCILITGSMIRGTIIRSLHNVLHRSCDGSCPLLVLEMLFVKEDRIYQRPYQTTANLSPFGKASRKSIQWHSKLPSPMETGDTCRVTNPFRLLTLSSAHQTHVPLH